MADSFIIIDEPAVTDKKLDTEQVVVGANTVERERFIIAGLGATDFIRPVAHDAPSAGNPMPIGGYAKAAAPTDVSADGDRVNAWFDLAGRLAIHDGGGSLTVDGSLAVTNAGTFVVQENGAALTALQLIDDVVFVDDTATHATGTSKGILLMAAATPTDAAVDANDIGALAMTLARELKVSLTTALPAGTAAIGKLSANSGVDIGDVDVTSLPNVTLAAGTNTNEVVGDVAADIAVAGNPVLIGVRASTAIPAAMSADGDSNYLWADLNGAVRVVGRELHDAAATGASVRIGGKAETSPKGITVVADGDFTEQYHDSDGIQMVKLNTSGADLLSEAVSNTDGNSTAFSNFSAVASTFNYVTAVSVFRTDAGTSMAYIDFRDGTAGSVLYRIPLPPLGGAVLSSAQPLFKTSANTALAFDVSSALTTVYISVSGHQSKV